MWYSRSYSTIATWSYFFFPPNSTETPNQIFKWSILCLGNCPEKKGSIYLFPRKCDEIQFHTIPCVSRERWLLGLGFCNHITGDKTSQASLRHEYKTSYIYGRSVFPLEYVSRGANGYYIYLPSCRLVHSTCSPSKRKLHHKAFLYTGCPTCYWTCISLIILPLMRILQRNLKRTYLIV